MPWDSAGRWVPEPDDVASRLTGLLDTNSGYIQTARAAGQRAAGRRGLLNSSLAAGAGETAAISAAAPIAAQDAQQTFQRNQAVLEGGLLYDNQSRLAQQRQGFDMENARFNQGTQFTLQERENAAQIERQRLQQQGATEAQLRDFDQRTAEQIRGQSGQLTLQEREAEFQRRRDELAQQGATATQLREFDQRTAEQVRSIGGQESLTRLQQSGQLTLQQQEAAFQRDRDLLGQAGAEAMQRLQQGGALTLQEREASFQRERDVLQQQGATAAQLREFDQRMIEQTAQLSSAERVAAARNDTELTQIQVGANAQLTSNYLTAFSNLADAQNIPADVRASYIAEFQRILTQGQNLIQVVNTVPLTWGGQTLPTQQPPVNQPAPEPAFDPALNTGLLGGNYNIPGGSFL